MEISSSGTWPEGESMTLEFYSSMESIAVKGNVRNKDAGFAMRVATPPQAQRAHLGGCILPGIGQNGHKHQPQRRAPMHHPIFWGKRGSMNVSRQEGEKSGYPLGEQQTRRELEEEAKKIRRLQVMIGMVMSVIGQDPNLTLEEASELAAGAKKAALAMFPDKELAFDLIYKPRLQRLIRDRFRLQ
jgi:hypothetical protein